MEYFPLLGFIFTVLVLLNHFLHHFWSRRGFVQLNPKFFVGNIGELFRLKNSIAEIYGELYERSKMHKLVGIYFFYRPALLVNDTALIQNILVKDFHHFCDHGLYVDLDYDPLSGHLFSLSGDKWRLLRAKLSPLFAPSKLKVMFPTFLDCATNLQTHVENRVKSGKDVIEVRDLLARYVTDIIASVAFGYNNDSINDPDNVFRLIGAKVFEPSLKSGLRALVTFLIPQMNKFVGIKVADQDVEDFMFAMVKQTIEHREKNCQERNDFMQLMIKLRNKGFVKGEETCDSRLSLEEVVAQAFVFFIAAFETSSSTMALCLYELSKNPKLQRKAQTEIDEILENCDSKSFDYDRVTQLKFLGCCLDETLRKYPPAPFLIRECTNSYQIPDTSLTIEKGTPLIISTFGIHRDPNIFEDPLSFKPERFLESSTGEGKASGLFYLPFGDGPRICIGMRMGKLTSRIGLFLLLSKFNFELLDKCSDRELEFSAKQFVLTLKNDMNMKVSLRK